MMINEQNITNTLNTWLEKYGFDCRVSGRGEEFCWYAGSNTIHYSTEQFEIVERLWNAFLKECGLQQDIETFYTCFLHEVFHSKTYYNFSELERQWDRLFKTSLNYNDAEKAIWSYFQFPTEQAATSAAIQYINKHPERIEELVSAVSVCIT